jgi:hypothetical protein
MNDRPRELMARLRRLAAAPRALAGRGGLRVPYALKERALTFTAYVIVLVLVLMSGLALPASMVLSAARNVGLIESYPFTADAVELLGMACVAAAVLVAAGSLWLWLEYAVFALAMLLMAFCAYTVLLSMICATLLMAVLTLLARPLGMEVPFDPLYLLSAAGWTCYGIYVWYDWLTTDGLHAYRRFRSEGRGSGGYTPASRPAPSRPAGGPGRSGWTSDPDGSTWASAGSGWSSGSDDDSD